MPTSDRPPAATPLGEAVEPPDAEKLRGIPWLFAHSATNSIFCTFTVFGSVFVLFLSHLGLPKTQIGLVLSLMPFALVLALFISPLVARAGFKRIYLWFWTSRNFVVFGLLFTPWILGRFGSRAAFLYVAGIIAVFALCRAVGMTAWMPWSLHTVPHGIRGKYHATSSVLSTLAGAAAVLVAGYVIGRFSGLSGFMGLMAVGAAIGVFSALCIAFVPGGRPSFEPLGLASFFTGLVRPLRDRNFLLYLAGYGLTTLGGAALAMAPLFMAEQVGMAADRVVYLQMGSVAAALLFSYVWGWAADRYGSKPVMLAGVGGMLAYPALLTFLPRHSAWSLPAALAVTFLYGVMSLGWNIGVTRYLFVSLIPPSQKTIYSAVYTAWSGVVQGAGPLAAGAALDACRGLEGALAGIPLDPFTPLFAANFLLTALALWPLGRLRSKGELPTKEFVAMFFQGNPIAAFESLVRYSWAGDERERVTMTERLGQAKSPLTADELIEALSDPSFVVRYEAIISIGRTRPNARLLAALEETLTGPETDLSTAAAHAFARIGDRRAIPALRKAFAAGHPALRARCARALGILGDEESIPAILAQFRSGQDSTLRLAYASALGSLRAAEAVPEILEFLRSAPQGAARWELALAVARVLGGEDEFIALWRGLRARPGMAIAKALTALAKDPPWKEAGAGTQAAFAECMECASRDDLDGAAVRLGSLIERLPLDGIPSAAAWALKECAARLKEMRAERSEYLLLALHALGEAWKDGGLSRAAP